MLKKILLVLLALVFVGFSWIWFNGGGELYALQRATAPETAPADYQLQDDSRVTIPVPQLQVTQAYNALKNVYWGDLHVHTVESFDAVLFGTTLTIEDAYRFAGGDSLRSSGGELMQLSRPCRGLWLAYTLCRRRSLHGRKSSLLANGNTECSDLCDAGSSCQCAGR
jgi:hypothetical protein